MVDFDDLHYKFRAKSPTAEPIRQAAYDNRIEICEVFDWLRFVKQRETGMAGILFIWCGWTSLQSDDERNSQSQRFPQKGVNLR